MFKHGIKSCVRFCQLLLLSKGCLTFCTVHSCHFYIIFMGIPFTYEDCSFLSHFFPQILVCPTFEVPLFGSCKWTTHCPSAEVGTSRSPEEWSQPWSRSSWVEMIEVVCKPGLNMAKPNHKHVFLKDVLCFFFGILFG